MKKIKEKIVWVVVIVTILYSMVMHYLDSQKIELFFGVGYSIGILMVPFILSLLVGLYFFIRKTFSWQKVKISFAITWVPVIIFFVLFFPPYGLFCKKDIMPELKELVRKNAIETNAQRRLYYNKLISIKVANISKVEDVKNIELLIRAKNNITKQKEIEDWNYLTCVSLVTKWESTYQTFLKENENNETAKIIAAEDSTFKNLSNSLAEKKRIQNEYFSKYNSLIDNYISENNNISIKNNTLMFKNNIAMDHYNSLQKEYDKALQLYLDYETKWKKESTNNIEELNKKCFNLKEYDTLIDMLKFDKYEK